MMRVTDLILPVFLAIGQFSFGQNAVDSGIASFNQGRYASALSQLREPAKKGDPAAQVFFALSQAASGDCASALPTLAAQSQKAKNPFDRMAGLAAAKCYSAGGNTTEAMAILQNLKGRYPDDADLLYLQAKVSMKAFNDATLAMFQRVPSSYRVHQLSAEIFETQNRYADAVTEYRKAIEVNPTAPDLHFRLGRALLLESHTPAALEQASAEFTAELNISPEDSASEFQLGQISTVQGNQVDARLHFKRAVDLSPRFIAAWIALGKNYAQAKQYADAISVLTRVTEIDPDNEGAHYALLSVFRNAGQLDKARAEKIKLDSLQKVPEGEFSDFLKKLGEKPPPQE